MRARSGVVALVLAAAAAGTLSSAELAQAGPLRLTGTVGGEGRFVNASAVATDPRGGLVVLDTGRSSVLRFDPSGRLIWQSGDTLGEQQLDRPRDVAISDDGHVYVSEWGANRIRKLAPDGRTVLGWGAAGNGATVSRPHALAEYDGQVFVVDSTGIRQIAPDGRIVRSLTRPLSAWYLAVAQDTAYLSGAAEDVVRVVGLGSGDVSRVGNPISEEDQVTLRPGFLFPRGTLGIDRRGARLWVVDQLAQRVQRFNLRGEVEEVCGRRYRGPFRAPSDVAEGPSDALFVADGARVLKFSRAASAAASCDDAPPLITSLRARSVSERRLRVTWRASTKTSVWLSLGRRGSRGRSGVVERIKLSASAGSNAATVKLPSVDPRREKGRVYALTLRTNEPISRRAVALSTRIRLSA